jgi:hypothetical protein
MGGEIFLVTIYLVIGACLPAVGRGFGYFTVSIICPE